MQEFSSRFERSAKRWELVVYPSLFAFVVLAPRSCTAPTIPISTPETNMNFGFNLSWWDRVLGTYWPCPAEGHEGMETDLEHQREPENCQPLIVLLLMPVRSKLGEYTINRRW